MGGGVSPLVKEGGWCVYASFVYTHNCADSVGRRGHSILFSPEHCLFSNLKSQRIILRPLLKMLGNIVFPAA